MKRLISDLYRVLYKITGNKFLSLSISVTYISFVTLVIIYGLCYLLKGWAPWLQGIIKHFSFPDIIFLSAVVLGLNVWMMLPLQSLSKDKRKRPLIVPIIVYSLVSLVLFLYSRYFDKIF